MEKKKNNIGVIIFLILLIGIGLWFWLGGEKGVGDKTESLTEILVKAKNVASVKYDMVITAPGQTVMTMKVWLKGEKMRNEGTFEGQSMTYILDRSKQLSYVYIPSQNIAMTMDFGKVQESVGESPVEQTESVTKYNPATLGTEVLDGKTCLVIEYTTETEQVKMWLWTKYGWPIRTESVTAEGTSVVELKNIEFGNIPDSMFELPAGAQMMEIPMFGL